MKSFDIFDMVCEIAERCEVQIRRAVSECAFIEKTKQNLWLDSLLGGGSDAAFGLLITLLPNLAVVRITQSSDGLDQLFKGILERIAYSYYRKDKGSPDCLTKLCKVMIYRRFSFCGRKVVKWTVFPMALRQSHLSN